MSTIPSPLYWIEPPKGKRESETELPLVFVCSPYRSVCRLITWLNKQRAKLYCSYAAQRGKVPLAPHLIFTQFLDDGDLDERDAGIYLGLQLLRRCSEVWCFGGRLTDGMRTELEFAKKHSIPIRYFDSSCEELIL